MNFTLEHTDPSSGARAGELQTAHGIIKTPVFMPVGTAGTVKAVHQRELTHDIGAQIILGNTYHLYLRPGLDILRSEEHTSELQSLMRISYAVFCLKKKQDRY